MFPIGAAIIIFFGIIFFRQYRNSSKKKNLHSFVKTDSFNVRLKAASSDLAVNTDNLDTSLIIDNLDESLKQEVTRIRSTWTSTAAKVHGISLVYRLISEHRYLDAKIVNDLFLHDNPGHGVGLKQRDQINYALDRNVK